MRNHATTTDTEAAFEPGRVHPAPARGDANEAAATRSAAPDAAPWPDARERRAMLAAGLALAAMAVLSPIGMLIALPAGQTLLAGIVAIVVALLDVVVAIALWRVLRHGGAALARAAVVTRLVYAMALAVAAVALLVTADAGLFDAIWGHALALFGVHLVLVGIAALRGRRIPAWIGALVALAGAGYLVDWGVAFVVRDAPFAVSSVTFIGEVALLVWLIWRGVRRARRSPAVPDAAAD